MILVPIVLFAIDVSTMFFGSSLNANICRDAARTAAAGPPAPSPLNGTVTNISDPPKMRALQVVRKTQSTQGAIRLRTGDSDVVVSQNVTNMPSAPFGGIVSGTVTVQTTCDVYPPFLLAAIVGRHSFQVSTTQTFPYTWVMPATYTAMVPGGSSPNGGGPCGVIHQYGSNNNSSTLNTQQSSSTTNTTSNTTQTDDATPLSFTGGNTGEPSAASSSF